MGYKRAFKRVRNEIRCTQIANVFYYIPILKTLQEQLKAKAILQMVFAESNRDSSGGYLHGFNDGLLVHNHPLFSTDNIAFSTDSMACFTFMLMTRSFIHLLLAMTPLI